MFRETILDPVYQLLGVLDPDADSERLLLKGDATHIEHPVGVARTVARCENEIIAGEFVNIIDNHSPDQMAADHKITQSVAEQHL
jgi:hypothetical protein